MRTRWETIEQCTVCVDVRVTAHAQVSGMRRSGAGGRGKDDRSQLLCEDSGAERNQAINTIRNDGRPSVAE